MHEVRSLWDDPHLQLDGESGPAKGHAGIHRGHIFPQSDGGLPNGNPAFPERRCIHLPRAHKQCRTAFERNRRTVTLSLRYCPRVIHAAIALLNTKFRQSYSAS